MRYTTITCTVQVVGHIWQPGAGLCAMEYTLRDYDLDNLGEWTRENVESWLATNSGDFQEIVDFRADFSRGAKNWVSEWADEEKGFVFSDAMWGDE